MPTTIHGTSQMPGVRYAAALLLVLCVGCGAQRATPNRPGGGMPCTASPGAAPTIAPTRAPTPYAAQLATMRAAPTVEPGLDGFVIDFVLAVSAGNDARARTYYLAPTLYAKSTSIRREIGLPNVAEGCGFTIAPQVIEATANRVVFETTIETGTQTVTKQFTLERTPTYWVIVAIR